MNLILAIAAGGAIGSVLRYFAILAGNRLHDFFPAGTLLVNIAGSFLIGLLMEGMTQKWNVSDEMRGLLVTGVLGGFTTFSAFSFDFYKLVGTDHVVGAIAYVAASVVLSLLAVFAGAAVIKGVFA